MNQGYAERDASRYKFVILVWLLLFCAPVSRAATVLKPVTVDAWNVYLKSARARTAQRSHSSEPFLAADSRSGVKEKVRNGEIVVSPVGQSPKQVPGGLIHDWIGTAFIPNTNIEDVLQTVRDYDHYKLFYDPNVMESRTLSKSSVEDRFEMLLANRSLVAKTVLASQCSVLYVRVDEHRWYSTSDSTRIEEISNFNTGKQSTMEEGEGSGLIWRLASTTHFEEQDGGVYVELEAIALSRDVPGALRWMIMPIVRHVSESSLTTSLQQTGKAVRAQDEAGRQMAEEHRNASSDSPRVSNLSLGFQQPAIKLH